MFWRTSCCFFFNPTLQLLSSCQVVFALIHKLVIGFAVVMATCHLRLACVFFGVGSRYLRRLISKVCWAICQVKPVFLLSWQDSDLQKCICQEGVTLHVGCVKICKFWKKLSRELLQMCIGPAKCCRCWRLIYRSMPHFGLHLQVITGVFVQETMTVAQTDNTIMINQTPGCISVIFSNSKFRWEFEGKPEQNYLHDTIIDWIGSFFFSSCNFTNLSP